MLKNRVSFGFSEIFCYLCIMKEYTIRLYIFDDIIGCILNAAIDMGILFLLRSYEGVGRLLAIYDVRCARPMLLELIKMGVDYLPLNKYEEFIITCPICGERIDDNMILKAYDEHLLGGHNILCNRQNCGYQLANVRHINLI